MLSGAKYGHKKAQGLSTLRFQIQPLSPRHIDG